MPTAPMRMGVRSRENLATGLYNGMIAPVAPFAISGAIWYQGESNGSEGRAYTHKMRALITGWRRALADGQMPVYFVQLPGSGARDGWPYLREQQRLLMQRLHTSSDDPSLALAACNINCVLGHAR